MSDPLVSVYIPTHNRSALLRRALDSVAAQTYRRFEIVILDDCSTDDTQAVVTTFHAEHPSLRIRCLINEAVRGACNSRNRAIEAAEGDFVTGLDDDDEFRPDRLARFVECYRRRPGIYYSNYLVVNKPFSHNVRNPATATVAKLLLYNAMGSQVFARREQFAAMGGFDPVMPALQDQDAWIRLLLGQDDVAFNVGKATYVVHKAHRLERISTNRTALKGKLLLYERYKHRMSRKQKKYTLFQIRKQLHRVRVVDLFGLVPSERRPHEFALVAWNVLKKLIDNRAKREEE